MTGSTASATALSLVAFADTPERAERLRGRMAEVTQRHRTQTLLIDASANDLDADAVAAQIHAGILPGVPSALFWASESLRDGRFERAASLCTVALVNTSQMRDGRRALHDLAALSPALDRRVHDLSYLHLSNWQDLIARFFDDAELAAELPVLNRLLVRAGAPAHAFYLAGWLASRLAWKPCGERELCNPEGSVIRVEIAIDGPYYRIDGVELCSERATFAVEADDAAEVATLTVTASRTSSHSCAPLRPFDFVAAVDHALAVQRTDALFNGTLQHADALLEHER